MLELLCSGEPVCSTDARPAVFADALESHERSRCGFAGQTVPRPVLGCVLEQRVRGLRAQGVADCTVTQRGAEWCRVQRSTDWHRVVQSGQCRLAQCGTEWCKVAPSDTEWCRVAQSPAEYRLAESGAE